MLLLNNIKYLHPNKDILFEHLNFSIQKNRKVALVGNNGAGKSTLFKIMAGVLSPAEGTVKASAVPYYVPQHFGQYDELTVAEALGVSDKIIALRAILDGDVSEENMALLNDDWTIEERCTEALDHWELKDLSLTQQMGSLSGGQKTKVFLAGISIHDPEIVLLDEPSNHLDISGRELLYQFITSATFTLVVISHDRILLNLPDEVHELSKRGITVYGGNYDFYAEQKKLENDILLNELKGREKSLRKAKETERESAERQQKLDARGKKKQEKAGIPTIMMNTLRNNAEKSSAKLKSVHAEKTANLSLELNDLRKELPETDKMKFGFDDSALHKGKILLKAVEINFQYGAQCLWDPALDLQITSGERLALKGLNGSGKTTLIKLLLAKLQPTQGNLSRADHSSIYIDQDYSLINDRLTVFEQAEKFNTTSLQEHEIKVRLNRFLFAKEDWNKPCSALSGGERMRLVLCCLTIGHIAPDMIILDEPTNNLDMQNIGILTAAINDYNGTLIVVSHDEHFLEKVNIQRSIQL